MYNNSMINPNRVEKLKSNALRFIQDYMRDWGIPVPSYLLTQQLNAASRKAGLSAKDVLNLMVDEGILKALIQQNGQTFYLEKSVFDRDTDPMRFYTLCKLRKQGRP